MPTNLEALNAALNATYMALESPGRRRNGCRHPSDVDEGKDFWQFKSGKRINAYLFRNTYECQVCGEWKTIIEESPSAP